MTFFQNDEQLNTTGNAIVEAVRSRFPRLAPDQIAVTWIVYDRPVITNTGGAIAFEEFWQYPVRGFHYRGVERMYPASVVKLFYLVAIHEWLDKGMISPSLELDRALRDTIVDSSNDATSLIVDVLSGTTSGPELSPGPFETWKYQRNIVNRYYQSLQWPELASINVNQKTWGDGPYGRERAFVGELMDNRNMLTTNAVARLLHAIVGGVAVSSERSQAMMKLLQRDLNAPEPPPGEENQVQGFFGSGLPPEASLWSKAGWTSQVRHDAAYIELPDCLPFLLVAFIQNPEYSQNREILPFLAQSFGDAIGQMS
jgi:beta-lactamase class A